MGGILDIAITKQPHEPNSWCPDEGDHHTDLGIKPEEWKELFRKELKVPYFESNNPEDYFNTRFANQEREFLEYLTQKGFPLLGRIWHIYQDAAFMPDEIESLLSECKLVLNILKSELAKSAINKLIKASKEALEYESGIALLSD